MGNAPPLKRIGTLSGKGFAEWTRSRRGGIVRDTYLPLNEDGTALGSAFEGMRRGKSERGRGSRAWF